MKSLLRDAEVYLHIPKVEPLGGRSSEPWHLGEEVDAVSLASVGDQHDSATEGASEGELAHERRER